jgi:GTP pyrophosphokinase
MVALNTPLRTGQTVEIVTVRAGAADGPSRDWLNASLGYVRSARARAEVRQWFHAADLARDVAAGRARVERMLQREGRTALGFEELARRAGFERADDLFVAVARDELGPRALADAVRPPAADAVPHGATPSAPPADASVPVSAPRGARGGTTAGRAGSVSPVSVVGVDFLLTQLARCCRPAPPDPIVGFVTRGQGVSVHRAGCRTFAAMAQRAPERVLETDWGGAARRGAGAGAEARYAVEVALRASDRPGLLRDVTEVMARDRLNIVAMRTLTRDGVAQLQITVEVPGVPQLERTLVALRGLDSVLEARRR